MAINNIPAVASYVGNNSTSTSYPIPFRFLDIDHIQLYIDGLLVESGYSVLGVDEDEGGQLVSAVAYPSDVEVVIIREVPLDQVFQYENGNQLPAENIEKNFDRTVMQIQQLKEELSRSPSLPPGVNIDDVRSTTLGVDETGLTTARTKLEQIEHLGIAGQIATATSAATEAEASRDEAQAIVNSIPSSVLAEIAPKGTEVLSTLSYEPTTSDSGKHVGLLDSEQILITNNGIERLTVAPFNSTTQIFLDGSVFGSKQYGLLSQGEPITINASSLQTFVFGELSSLALADVNGMALVLDSDDIDLNNSTITGGGKVFDLAQSTNYGVGIGGDSYDAYLQTETAVSFAGDFELEFRIKLSSAPSSSSVGSSVGFTYNAADGSNGLLIRANDIYMRGSGGALAHGLTDLTVWNTFRLVRIGSDYSLYVNGQLVTTAPSTGSYSIRQIGRWGAGTSTTSFGYDLDYLVAREGSTVALDLQFGVDATNVLNTGTQGGTITSGATPPALLSLGSGEADANLISAPVGDAGLIALDTQNILYTPDGTPIILDLASIDINTGDQLLVDYNGDSDYTVALFESVESIKAGAIEADISANPPIILSENLIPIYLFTGQSNNNGVLFNVSPYDTDGLQQLIAHTVAGVETPVATISSVLALGKNFGASYNFAKLLDVSDSQFAIAQSGQGGTAAISWNPIYSNNEASHAFDAVERLKLEVESQNPGKTAYLAGFIIQQGEREASTTADWSKHWSSFVDEVRTRYGADLPGYVVALNDVQREAYGDTNVDRVLGFMADLCVDATAEYYRGNMTLIEPSSIGIDLFDGGTIHYSRDGYVALGQLVFDAIFTN